jgi:hypothetical protein
MSTCDNFTEHNICQINMGYDHGHQEVANEGLGGVGLEGGL